MSIWGSIGLLFSLLRKQRTFEKFYFSKLGEVVENKKGKKKWKRGSSPDNWVKTTLLTTKRLVLLLLAPLFSPYITWVPNPFSTTCIVSRCESRRAAIYGLWAIGQIGRWGNLIVSMDVWLLQKVLHARMEARAHVIMDLRDYFWEKEKKASPTFIEPMGAIPSCSILMLDSPL